MKVVVTGGTGFLGHHLVERLVEEGYDVVFTGRHLRKPLIKDSQFVAADLADLTALSKIIKDAKWVFHCAALASPWGRKKDFFASNVTGTNNVIAACLQAKVDRLIHVSTPSLYANGHDRFKVKEDDPLPEKAINMYAHTKRLAEEKIKQASLDLPTISIRPRAIFGIGDNAIMPRFVAALKAKRLPIIGDGETLADLSYCSNVVDALLLCAQADEAHLGKVYNISNGNPVKLWRIIRQIAEYLQLPQPKRRLSYRTAHRLATALEFSHRALGLRKEPLLTRYSVTVLARSMTLDISAAESDLGYNPRVSIQRGLSMVMAQYKNHA